MPAYYPASSHSKYTIVRKCSSLMLIAASPGFSNRVGGMVGFPKCAMYSVRYKRGSCKTITVVHCQILLLAEEGTSIDFKLLETIFQCLLKATVLKSRRILILFPWHSYGRRQKRMLSAEKNRQS
jgi:hypothetical protein